MRGVWAYHSYLIKTPQYHERLDVFLGPQSNCESLIGHREFASRQVPSGDYQRPGPHTTNVPKSCYDSVKDFQYCYKVMKNLLGHGRRLAKLTYYCRCVI